MANIGNYFAPASNYNVVPYGGIPGTSQSTANGLQGYPTSQNINPQQGGSSVLNQLYGNSRSPIDPMFGYLGAASAGTLRTVLGLTTTDAQPLGLHSFVANTLPPLLSGISAYAVQHYFDPYRATDFPAKASASYSPLIPSYSDSNSGYNRAYSGAQSSSIGYGDSNYGASSINPYTTSISPYMSAAPSSAFDLNLRAQNAVVSGNNVGGSSVWNVQTGADFLATVNRVLGSLGANINAGGNANLSNNNINYGAVPMSAGYGSYPMSMPMYAAMPVYRPISYQTPAYQSPIHIPVLNYANGGTYGGYGFA